MLGVVDGCRAIASRRVRTGDVAVHCAALAIVLAWVIGVCDIPLYEYVLYYVYPGISFTLLRSFAEHQAENEVSDRIVAVEAHPLMALLYLNNNLHPAHHTEPGSRGIDYRAGGRQ